jgi:ribosomal protein S18 acetylase RimI-like enzyme
MAAGFVMARLDFGDFGHMEPVASIDTIGVDPAFAGAGVGKAMISQLFANLAALGVDQVETTVADTDLNLLGFLYACGFQPSARLAFDKLLG